MRGDYVIKYHRICYQIPLNTNDNAKIALKEDDDNVWEYMKGKLLNDF